MKDIVIRRLIILLINIVILIEMVEANKLSAQTYLTNSSIEPENPTNIDIITFRVTYVDTDGKQPKPGYPRVYIYLGNQLQPADSPLPVLRPVDPLDNEYGNGKDYYGTTALPFTGTHTYKFEAFNVDDRLAVGTPTVRQIGPVVTGPNIPPLMYWTQENGYRIDGVNPNSGEPGTMFTYKVGYQDNNNDYPMPGYPKVYIYNPNGTLFTVATMTLESGDGDWRTGAVYVYATNTIVNSGVYKYKFEAKDIWNSNAGGTPTYTWLGPEVSTPPVLTWTGKPGYETDGVEPEYTSLTSVYTYRIKYSDADGDPPHRNIVYVRIYKDGLLYIPYPLPMYQDITSGNNYKAGVIYSFSYRLTENGVYSYIFEAKDYLEVPAVGTPTYTLMIGPIITTPPTLSWAREIRGYELDGIEPDKGKSGDVFTYLVKYTDEDNDPPLAGYPRLYVFRGGDEPLPGSPFIMDHYDPSDINYTDGKLYKQELPLYLTGTEYNYRFEVKDIHGVAPTYSGIPQPPVGTKTGPKISSPPILSFVPTPPYNGTSGVDILNGQAPMLVTYKVMYKDVDNDAPYRGAVYLHILRNGAEYPAPGIKYPMSISPPYNYSDGVVYYRSITLPRPGSYSYYFSTQDANELPASGTPTKEHFGPLLTGIDTPSAPFLLFTGERGYENDGVEPELGSPDIWYTFRVKYEDANNDPPQIGYPLVKIYDGSTATVSRYGTMTRVSPGTVTYAAGVIYEAKIKLPAPSTLYMYQFEAYDNTDTRARGVGTGLRIGPVVSSPPELVNPRIVQQTGAVGTRFTFEVKYKDAEGHFPRDIKVHILIGGLDIPGSPFPLIYSNLTEPIADGRTYYQPIQLMYGNTNYSYYFVAMDRYGLVATPTVTYKGPIVTGGINWKPELFWLGTEAYISDGINPEVGTPGTLFTFKVRYRDLNNDLPQPGYPKLHIGKNGVWISLPMTWVADGIGTQTCGIYMATTTLQTGEYRYWIEVYENNVANNSVRLPIREEMSGPKVTHAPILTWTGEVGFEDDGVNPNYGTVATTPFTYKVKYYDADGDEPEYVQLWLYKDGVRIKGSPFSMSFVPGSGNKADGYYMATFSCFTEPGIYSYIFKAKRRDSMMIATLGTFTLFVKTYPFEYFILNEIGTQTTHLPFNVIIKAVDSQNNITQYPGTPTFVMNDLNGIIEGAITSIDSNSWIATVTIYNSTNKGINTIIVKDTSTGKQSTSNTFLLLINKEKGGTITLTTDYGTTTVQIGTSTEDYRVEIGIPTVSIPENGIKVSLRAINVYGRSEQKITTFSAPVYIEIPYPDVTQDGLVDNTSPVIDEDTLKLYVQEGNEWVLVVNSNVNTSRNVVYGTVSHLSNFILIGSPTSAPHLGKVCVYPNPYLPNSGHTHITFGHPTDINQMLTSKATIKIYTIAGELVDTIEETNDDGYATWIPTGLASGIYIYVITNPAGEKVIGKIGIIK